MGKAATETAPAVMVDEYDLGSDEFTKEMLAAKAKVTLRAVEKWKSAGLIQAKKVRRRDDKGNVREMLIFMGDDIDAFLAEKDAPTVMPQTQMMVKANAQEDANIRTGSLMIMKEIVNKMTGGDDRERFITVETAIAEYGLNANTIAELRKEGILRTFHGPRGVIKISRKQLEEL